MLTARCDDDVGPRASERPLQVLGISAAAAKDAVRAGEDGGQGYGFHRGIFL